ncbi:MAG: 6-phosphogluconolactonase [Terriglobia bacterium]
MRGTLVICTDLESLSREAARRVVAAVEAQRPWPFCVALAGGSTPRQLYELLASGEWRHRIPWDQLHFFWGDERLVPHDHRQSNYRMVREALLKHVPVPQQNIHPVPTQASLEATARAYEQELRAHFGHRWGVPGFDLILLGLGADGHTASLFPGAPALEDKQHLVVAHRPAGYELARVTLTLPVLNHARRVFFLVSGASKALALRDAFEGTGQRPAQRVAPKKGELVWLVDSAAASRLTRVRVESTA